MAVRIRRGGVADRDAAVAVFARSNLARRRGVWPHRASSVARLEEHLDAPESWLVVAEDGPELIGMASAEPSRDDDGAGAVIPGGCFLSHLFVVPERWGEGVGGRVLDAVLADARARSYRWIRLWTDEDNERSHLLYRSRGFRPTGRTSGGEGEWARDLAQTAKESR